MVARRITKPQGKFLGSNLTDCSFFIHFFIFIFRGGGSDFIILFMSYFFLLNLFFILFLFFIPLTCIRHIYIKTSITTQTTVNSEIYANSVKKDIFVTSKFVTRA